MELHGHAIRHARLPAHLGRRAGLRGTLERWLAARDLRRYGLPEGAIVFVRGLRASWAQVAGEQASARGDALAAALIGVRRPALDAAAIGEATAVWFSDAAELLACMARDSLAGPLHAHWWWRTLLRGNADPSAAIAHWIGSARAVPRAVERLKAMQPGAAWFARWDSAASSGLLDGLARHYPISHAVRRFVESGAEDELGARPVPSSRSLPDAWPLGDDSRRSADVGLAGPRSAAARLQFLCVQLARDPSCAADARLFADRSRRDPAQTGFDVPAVSSVAVAASSATAAYFVPERARAPAIAASGASAEDRSTFAPDAHTEAAASRTSAPFDIEVVDPALRDPSVDRADDDSSSPDRAPQAPAAAAKAGDAASSNGDILFDTSHGGLFFAINAALRIGLYGDFSRPLHRRLAASPSRFLFELGRAVGGRLFLRDPLAAWLESGFARDAENAPHDPRETHAVEPEWLQAFAEDRRPLRAVFEAERLTLWHPAGFPVFGEPACAGDGEAQLAARLAALGLEASAIVRVAAASRHPRRPRPTPTQAAVPADVLAYVRARLVLALGLGDTRRLASTLLRIPARVRLCGDRIDVGCSLCDLPLAVRLAGLDRDPGWLPAAGRDLRFHFD